MPNQVLFLPFFNLKMPNFAKKKSMTKKFMIKLQGCTHQTVDIRNQSKDPHGDADITN